MLKRLLFCAAFLFALSICPLFADYTDLQTTTAAVIDDQVLVQVENANSTCESARIQVTVQVDDGSFEVLTVPTVTYGASSTSVVSAKASARIVQIIDDPDPILP